MSPSLFEAIAQSGAVAKAILIILLLTSVFVWALLIARWRELIKVQRVQNKFIQGFNEAPNLAHNLQNLAGLEEQSALRGIVAQCHGEYLKMLPLASPSDPTFSATFSQFRKEVLERLERLIEATIVNEEKQLQWGQTFLATVSITAPFVGLFGTVVGIINSFQNMANLKSVDLSVVAPGISEALVATAAGLFTAIPASVGFNLLRGRIQHLVESMEQFSLLLLNQFHLHLLGSHESASSTKN